MATLNDTKQDVISQALNYFSTARHEAFSLEKMLGSYEAEDAVTWIDPLNPIIMAFISLPRLKQMRYDNTVPITTNSYNIYGNTSLWWLILACSDYIHPHQIPRGELINIPDVATVIGYINSTVTKGNQGQTIII